MSPDSDDFIFQDSFSSNLNGVDQVKDQIINLCSTKTIDSIIVGQEFIRFYQFSPAVILQNSTELSDYEIELVRVNSNEIIKFNDGGSRSDAYYIAELLKSDGHSENVLQNEKYLALQRLTRLRCDLVFSMVRAKKCFINDLFYKVNQSSETDDLMSNSRIIAIITEDLTSEGIMKMSIDELLSYANNHGEGSIDLKNFARSIKDVKHHAYVLDQSNNNSLDIVLSVYYKAIRTYQKTLRELDDSIEHILNSLFEVDILKSLPGVDYVYAAGIIAETGNVERFDKESQIASYAKLGGNNRSSSVNLDSTSRPHSRDMYLHQYLVEATNQLIVHDQMFADYFERQKQKALTNPRRRALTLATRKFVRVLDYLLREHQTFDPSKQG
ncbi:MAG: transposase [Companilactobacillus sp.]|uniref:transposase n=1 Tax=Companilactobacillus sp. TaxID=2767905 RepID=UPI0025C1903F|nr:transposase [Companilactobacillus sp.]MCH4009476.1 transposase [Companilactobacillus sp.]MCH4050345.1 transposase [Companilactobacillus sp.]MCH4077418.1 transposase [Companilactobacillus sp.]MCH4125994.1 transposase [Companilactobacillus sp.]